MQLLKTIIKALGSVWYPVKWNAMFFVFMYSLGIVVAYATKLPYDDAKIYENTYYELFFDLYVVGVFLCILPKRVRGWVRCLLSILAYALALIDVFCFVKFNATINQSMLILARETTGSETAEFFETYLTWDLFDTAFAWVLIVILLHILCAVIRKILRKRCSRRYAESVAFVEEKAPWLHYVIDIALSIAVVVTLNDGWEDTMTNKDCIAKTFGMETIGDVEKILNVKPRAEMYQPAYRLAFSIYCNNLIDKQLIRLKDGLDDVAIDSCEHKSDNIVLIIGESYNKHHSQLYGYDKPTTPRQVALEKSGMLTKFTDVTTPWNLTSFVFKHLMTTYCVGDDGDWCDYPLFCQLFRKAGYQVNFLTNQFIYHAKDAVFDASGGFFLNDQTLSEAQFDVRNEQTHLWDEDLLKDYDRLVKPGNQLTIFHLMGQHVNYRIRCPKSKFKFYADQYDLPQNTKKEKRLIAYYDCAVWYNDSVVDRIVDRFKDEDAIVIYFPDHGEEVYGPGSLHHCGRNHTTNITRSIAQQEYEIPMWIYCSEKYAKTHPDVVKAVKEAADKPFMIDAASHVLMGLAGIKCKYYRPEMDLLHKDYDTKRKRLMQHVVEYSK